MVINERDSGLRESASVGLGQAPSASEVVARAEAMTAYLVARQGETEQRTYYGEDVHEKFVEAGFYKILVPRRYGGLELGVETFAQVGMALARGCPSTGWMYVFGAAHALAVATLFEGPVQAELFGDGHFICPMTVAPSGVARRSGDGWIVAGTFRYCSGVPYATHFMGHALVDEGDGSPPSPLLFVLPRSQWHQEDDWGAQLGLRGSGSHSITVRDAYVPAEHVLHGHFSQFEVSHGTPGRSLHDNPEYGGGPLSFMLLEIGLLGVGMAAGAVDAYEDLMRSRTTIFGTPVIRTADPDYQQHYGMAVGMLATAETAVLGAMRQWRELSARGAAAVTREQELRLAGIGREAFRLSWRAVAEHLFPSAGSSAALAGERMERVWRDMSTVHSHAGLGVFLSTIANRELAKEHFGGG